MTTSASSPSLLSTDTVRSFHNSPHLSSMPQLITWPNRLSWFHHIHLRLTTIPLHSNCNAVLTSSVISHHAFPHLPTSCPVCFLPSHITWSVTCLHTCSLLGIIKYIFSSNQHSRLCQIVYRCCSVRVFGCPVVWRSACLFVCRVCLKTCC